MRSGDMSLTATCTRTCAAQLRRHVRRGREAILEIARGVIGMGGAPLAEHGVGRSALKQHLLRELYGA